MGVMHRNSSLFHSLADKINLYMRTLAYHRTHRMKLIIFKSSRNKQTNGKKNPNVKIVLEFVGICR